MKKILIIYDPAIDSDVLIDRIKSLGSNYTFWDNHWFIKTNLSTKDVYDKLSLGEFESTSFLVIELSQKTLSYYGRMSPSLWEWLSDS